MRARVTAGLVSVWLSTGCARAPCPDPQTAAAPVATPAQPTTLVPPVPSVAPTPPNAVASRALAYIHDLHGPKRLEVYAKLSERFRSNVSQAKFVEILDGVKADVGNFIEARVLVQNDAPAQSMLMIAAFYERGTRNFTIALDEKDVIVGLFVKPFGEGDVTGPGPAPGYVSKQAYSLPLSGAWHVANGGTNPGENLHIGNKQQWYAFDVDRVDADGKEFKGEVKRKEDYYAWGQPVIAPADGTVVTTVTSVPDQEIGSRDGYFVPGNTVVIDHGEGEFSFLCHFQQHSIVVKPGQRVKRGQTLGKVGNSGNTSGPHLHWHLGSDADFTRAHGLPIRFAPLTVNGVRVEAAALKKGDTVANASP